MYILGTALKRKQTINHSLFSSKKCPKKNITILMASHSFSGWLVVYLNFKTFPINQYTPLKYKNQVLFLRKS